MNIYNYIIILIISPVIFSCSFNKNEIPELTSTDYKIYSCVINTLFASNAISNDYFFVDKNSIAFYKYSPPLGFFHEIAAKDRISNLIDYYRALGKYKKKFSEIMTHWYQFDDDELIKDLLIKNIFSFKIQIDSLKISIPLKISTSNNGSYQDLTGKRISRIGFSRIGINESESASIVYVSYYCGLLCANWSYYFLIKVNNEWKIVDKLTLAVS